ncbi:hypothetical protein NA56DRAFT_756892 [Hyaloscypha hepaticicola]|uniref:Uncharacterized protein n=1 Tax=Hyaloscypha hepaticicola TaxID=2082293 RepID=A0A2J6PDF9_9HELO|nr:hypothetical protein NA56DRAFT_756892 [Hyaloscypha hepaticicola]
MPRSHGNHSTLLSLLPCHPGCLTNLAQWLAFCGLAQYLDGTPVARKAPHDSLADICFTSRLRVRPSGHNASYWWQRCHDLPLEMQAEIRLYCNAIISGRSGQFLFKLKEAQQERPSQTRQADRASKDRAERHGLRSGVFIEFTSLPMNILLPTSEIPPCERWLNGPRLDIDLEEAHLRQGGWILQDMS